mmetsp:Transcript_3288/g.9451  ORF Transcript_3288/g.9451 Transcript_3288/m.9451 type:complete len:253 (+) Transcript_3288:165-923(+)
MSIAAAVLDWLSANSTTTLIVLMCTVVFLYSLRSSRGPLAPLDDVPEESKKVGDMTVEALQRYDGRDPTGPVLLAVRGTIFDVTKGRPFYGRGGGYNIFAGHECSRALALMSLQKEDVNGDLEGLTEDQLGVLNEWEAKFKEKYTVVGKVLQTKSVTPAELAEHDGRDPSKPILLAIRGCVYDVSKGRDFYGPGGAYPFAGKEVARALAKTSLEPKDFTAVVDDLSQTEMDTLRGWEDKFLSKYAVYGKLQQ